MDSTLRFSPINEQRTTLAFVSFALLWGLTFGTALSGAPSTSDAVEKGAAQGQDPPGTDEQHQAPPSSSEDENLSEQLDRNKGVITPPATGDTDIYTEAPNPNPGTTPVIPPPGTPGGDQSVEPK